MPKKLPNEPKVFFGLQKIETINPGCSEFSFDFVIQNSNQTFEMSKNYFSGLITKNFYTTYVKIFNENPLNETYPTE